MQEGKASMRFLTAARPHVRDNASHFHPFTSGTQSTKLPDDADRTAYLAPPKPRTFFSFPVPRKYDYIPVEETTLDALYFATASLANSKRKIKQSAPPRKEARPSVGYP